MQQASYHIARTFGSSFNHTDIEQPVLYTHGIRSWLIETRISGDQQLMTGRLHQPTPSAVSTFCVPRQQRAMDRLCARECGVHGHRRLSGDQSARGHRRNVMARAHWQRDRACRRFCKRPYSHIRDAGAGRLFAVVRNAAFPLRRDGFRLCTGRPLVAQTDISFCADMPFCECALMTRSEHEVDHGRHESHNHRA